MAKAVVCPVCNGWGAKLYPIGPTSEWGVPAVATGHEEKVCNGCGGKGWVEVSSSLLDNP